jgi:SAM-dependent methyltransferase
MEVETYSAMAGYYDPAYINRKDYNDLPFYLELAQAHGGPILEIACGTGRVLLEIARLGIAVDGVDASEGMLGVLREKLRKAPQEIQHQVRVFQGDMRTFALERRYQQVLIPFRSMQHMLSLEDQVNALNRAKAHLLAGGLLSFNVFYPNFRMLAEPMRTPVFDIEWPDPAHPNQTIRRYFIRRRINKLQQYFEGAFIFRTCEGDTILKEEEYPLRMGYYTYPHLLLLFRICGLQIREQYGSLRKDPMETCQEMVFVLGETP